MGEQKSVPRTWEEGPEVTRAIEETSARKHCSGNVRLSAVLSSVSAGPWLMALDVDQPILQRGPGCLLPAIAKQVEWPGRAANCTAALDRAGPSGGNDML